jgi:hypothetical protein
MTPSGTDGTDISLARLEGVARRLSWSADDLLTLKEEYSHEKAARGSSSIVTDEEWLKRKRALERRKLGTPRATDLFQQDLGET